MVTPLDDLNCWQESAEGVELAKSLDKDEVIVEGMCFPPFPLVQYMSPTQPHPFSPRLPGVQDQPQAHGDNGVSQQKLK